MHCFEGRSRAATSCCAWLVAREGLTLKDALARLRAARPSHPPRPNDGFMAQLLALDEIAYHNSILPNIRPDGTAHPLQHKDVEALGVFEALNAPSFEQIVPLHLVSARNSNIHASAIRPGMSVLVRRPCAAADRPHHTAPARVVGMHSREQTVSVEMQNGQRTITA